MDILRSFAGLPSSGARVAVSLIPLVSLALLHMTTSRDMVRKQGARVRIDVSWSLDLTPEVMT